MQRSLTPARGRTPPANIIDSDHYKLAFELVELRNENWQLTVSRWIPETGWTKMELFLTNDELESIRNQINGTGQG
jgi:hypothetical protein